MQHQFRKTNKKLKTDIATKIGGQIQKTKITLAT